MTHAEDVQRGQMVYFPNQFIRVHVTEIVAGLECTTIIGHDGEMGHEKVAVLKNSTHLRAPCPFGSTVLYHGSRAARHGNYVHLGTCTCTRCPTSVRSVLVTAAGIRLRHVRRSSFTVITASCWHCIRQP